MIDKFSDYIVYVDESGDHGLQNLDPNYPVFVLAFCIFHKPHYTNVVAPKLQAFKFQHFGHDLVVLHENEIRKEKSPFNIFESRQQRIDFIDQLTVIIDESNFVLVSCVIEKERLNHQYQSPVNPYHLALGFGLERVYRFLQEKSQNSKNTHIVVERRGKKEDDELELEFRRICDGANWFNKSLPFIIQFADKKTNSTGLQLADLVARPVGLHVLRPKQDNRAFAVLESKFYCQGGRKCVGSNYEGWGLKRFP
ncbi:MAG: 3-deoxy-D-manno-octulosonic acid transferase [Nitrosomonas sp.]|jgi:Protein of unknown function (DUF3800)|nr:MAG: 3-deoxy-D-manno-octulosonic acid transferase [Nitrosomonas sp.]